MKPQSLAALLLGSALFVTTLPTTATAADLAQLIADTAKWESGQSPEPLRQIEQLVRESAGKRAQRADVEAALVKLLAPTATFEARRFACQQLSVIGSDASVPALALLLRDKETVGIACLAFGNRPSAKVDQALRAALTTARDQARVQIISTLGNRRDAKAVKPLATFARDSDMAAAEAAIRALGMIASEPAAREIAALRKAPNPRLERALADASLRCAAQFAHSGKAKAAAAIYEELVALSQPANVRRGAFIGLAHLDKDGGQQRILQILRSGDTLLKPVAITAVRSLPSPTASETFARELPALTNQEQIWMIESLAVRADAPARAAVIRTLASADAGVRRAAAAALGQIGGATAVRPLASAIASARGGEEIRELVSALGSLPTDRDTDKAIIAEIKLARGETRANLIGSLAARRSPQVMTALFEEAGNPDAVVAKAAYRVLAKAATGEHLPTLVNQFAGLRNAELRTEVEGFVEQAVIGTDDPARRSAAVGAALKQSRDVDSRCALLRLLPACGDSQSLDVLKAAASETDERVRDAAVRALAEWPDEAAWPALFAVWKDTGNERHRSLALGGLVRLLGEANANPTDELKARYEALFLGTRADTEIKLLLGALGGVAHPEALKGALRIREERPGVRAEADAAVKRIAAAIKADYPDDARAALEQIAAKP